MTIAREQQRSRPRRVGLAFMGGVLVTMAAAVVWGLPRIEQSRAAAVQAELDRRGWTEIDVEFDGRDARVAGSAPEGVRVGEVASVIAAVPGVRNVSGMIMVLDAGVSRESPREVAAPTPATTRPERDPHDITRLILTNNGGLLVLRGTADDALAGLISDEAASLFGNVENRIQPAQPDPVAPEWIEMVTTTLGVLQEFDDVTVRINEERLEYEGRVTDPADGEQLQRRLRDIVGTVVEVSGTYDVVEAAGPVVTLDVVKGEATVRGRVAGREAATQLHKQLEAVFGAATNELETGAPRAQWVASIPFSYVPRSGTYTLTVTAEGAELAGSVVTENARTWAVTALQKAGFEVIDRLTADGTYAEGHCTADSLGRPNLSQHLFGPDGKVVANEPRAKATLKDLAVDVGKCDGAMLTMTVHADWQMSPAETHEFAHERGGALLEALAAFGIDADPVRIVGLADAARSRPGGARHGQIEFAPMLGDN